MNTFPQYPNRKELILDGLWQFSFLDDVNDTLENLALPQDFPEWQMVPGTFDTGCERPGCRGIGCYRTSFSWQTAHTLLLTVGGLGLAAKFWFDEEPVTILRLPYSTVHLELHPCPNRREHSIVIAVDNRFIPQATPLFSPYFDFYGYGGIYRSLKLQELNDQCDIDRIAIHTTQLDTGEITAQISFRQPVTHTLEALVNLDDDQPVPVLLQTVNGIANLELRVPDGMPWTPEHPRLHTLTVSLGADRIVERFGLRTIRTCGTDILLNDRPIRLLGACRHECHRLGPAVPPQQMLEDLKLLKRMGANFVRCVHYPQDQAFLDLCDEVGILVWQESLGWGAQASDVTDPDFCSLQLRQTELMVRNSYNHPSVILWAFLNEGCSDLEAARPLYVQLAQTIRNIQPDLLVSYACNRLWGEKLPDLCLDVCDVISFNTYPGWIDSAAPWTSHPFSKIAPEFERLATLADQDEGARGKPLIISENGCCGMAGQHDDALAQWSEEFQAGYLRETLSAVLANPRFVGLSIWQFIDSRSYVNATPGIRCKPLGMNLAGLLDQDRHPKQAYHLVSKCFHATPSEPLLGQVKE